MTFAVIPWLSLSINLLLIVFVLVCFLMTLIILMQRPKQDGLGAAFGGGVTDQVFGARTTNVLQRGTVYLGSAFFLLSLILAVLIGAQNKTTSTVTKADRAAKTEAAKPLLPPVETTPKSLSEELPTEDPSPVPVPTPAGVPADGTPAVVPPTVAPAPPVEITPVPTPAVETPPVPGPAPVETPAPAPVDGADKPQEP